VQYIVSVTVADVLDGDILQRRIVQVDPDYTLKRAERGRPHASRVDAEAWGAGGLTLLHPIAAASPSAIRTCRASASSWIRSSRPSAAPAGSAERRSLSS